MYFLRYRANCIEHSLLSLLVSLLLDVFNKHILGLQKEQLLPTIQACSQAYFCSRMEFRIPRFRL